MQFFSKSFLLTLAFHAIGFIPTTDAIAFKPQHLRRRDVTPTGMSFIYANSTKIECHITHVLELQGAGQIDMHDCRMMVKNFEDDGHYLMMASGWQSSVSLPYWAERTCMFGFTRLDDGTDTVYLGDGDFKQLVSSSINMQPDVKYMAPVEGTATCNTTGEAPAQMEWFVRQSPRNSTHMYLG